MLSERQRVRLDHIREHALLARSFVGDMSVQEFQADRKTVLAVTRCLEIISEASRHVGEDTKTRLSHLPWTQIAAAGNFYRHDYEAVRQESIWKTVRDELPPLLAAVEDELQR
jgi:uncharacterized protein with HEPN domain